MDMSSNPLTPDAQIVERLPYAFAKRHGVISARQLGEGFELWVRPGVRAGVLAEVQRALGGPLALRELANEAFDAALARAYERGASHAAENVTDMDANPDLGALAQSLPKVADLLESEDDAPIRRRINALFSQAVREGASDIHIEAFEGRSVVRFRRDGMLRDVIEPPQVAHGVIVSRIKIMPRLDIAEKRQPQDGRIALRLARRSLDVRVSILPTAHGERGVLRLLHNHAGRLDLTGPGMTDTTPPPPPPLSTPPVRPLASPARRRARWCGSWRWAWSRSWSPRACLACSPSGWCGGCARRAGARTSPTAPSRPCSRTATGAGRTPPCSPRADARPARSRVIRAAPGFSSCSS